MDQPALEGIVLSLESDGIHHVHPHDAPTLRLPWNEELHPTEVIVEGVAAHGLSPILVHSTSWRMDDGVLVLSFVVLVDDPGVPLPGQLGDDLVDRVELARGNALGPPETVEAHHVVEHGLRHLAWLVRDDEAIGKAVPRWAEALIAYEPEPFRAFGSG